MKGRTVGLNFGSTGFRRVSDLCTSEDSEDDIIFKIIIIIIIIIRSDFIFLLKIKTLVTYRIKVK